MLVHLNRASLALTREGVGECSLYSCPKRLAKFLNVLEMFKTATLGYLGEVRISRVKVAPPITCSETPRAFHHYSSCTHLSSQIYVPDDGNLPKYCTVFGHMMKSGGSTIKWALDTAQSPEERQPGTPPRSGVHAWPRRYNVPTTPDLLKHV